MPIVLLTVTLFLHFSFIPKAHLYNPTFLQLENIYIYSRVLSFFYHLPLEGERRGGRRRKEKNDAME